MAKAQEVVVNGIAVVITTAILVAILYPVYENRTEKRGRRMQCISNLKQLGTATQIYVTDYDNRYPPTSWDKEIYPYHKNRELLTCDRIENQQKKYGYAMNMDVMGIDANTIYDPGNFPVLFETDALAPDVVANLAARARSRHGRGSVVGRSDSSVKFVPDGPIPFKVKP